jgi:hypothetical protein
VWVDGVEFEAALGVQQATQRRLVDDAGGFGLVVEAFGVQADQASVCSGLTVGHDDVGVEVRVTASGGFMLVGDGHQAGQPLQVFVARDRVVHAGVAGVTVQIPHGRVDRLIVRGGEDFLGDVIGQCTDERDAFGRGEGEIEAMDALFGEVAPSGPVGRSAVIEPCWGDVGVGIPAIEG